MKSNQKCIDTGNISFNPALSIFNTGNDLLIVRKGPSSLFNLFILLKPASFIGHYCWLELLEQAGANKSKFSKIINTHQLELTSKQSNVHILYLLSSQE